MDRKVFPQLPILRPRPDLPTRSGRLIFELLSDFHAQLIDGRWAVVPAGYLSDGASKPWFAYLTGGPASRPYLLGALVHDWHCDLFRRGDRLSYLTQDGVEQARRQANRRLSPTQVHDNFRYHCIAAGEPGWRATYLHWATHVGCSHGWRLF